MQFQQVVDRRRMVRNFTDEPVSATQRDRILANALHAPSAGFSQGWAFLVLETQADRARFWAVTAGEQDEPDSWLVGMRRAPLLVVPLANKDAYLDRYAEPDKGWTDRDESRWPVPYWHVDTGMASLLMLLTVVDEELAACFFGVPPDRISPFREAFGVPTAYQPIGALAIGHGAPDRRSPSLRRGRREVNEVVHLGRW
ncbi:MAG TPA: nitroreductase family protein [Mycobacteriales bacterium]|nr:nitroreductase family protein [Mycobacteriales bacterium]